MNNTRTDINAEALHQLAAFPEDQPVHMLNYLKYKEIDEVSGKTGKALYKDYMEQATPFFQQIEAKISFKAKPSLMIIGPASEMLWDEVLIVTYASKKEFFKLIQLEGYPRHIRKQALSDSRIICCIG